MPFNPQGNPYTQAATGGMLWEKINAGLKGREEKEEKDKAGLFRITELEARKESEKRRNDIALASAENTKSYQERMLEAQRANSEAAKKNEAYKLTLKIGSSPETFKRNWAEALPEVLRKTLGYTLDQSKALMEDGFSGESKQLVLTSLVEKLKADDVPAATAKAVGAFLEDTILSSFMARHSASNGKPVEAPVFNVPPTVEKVDPIVTSTSSKGGMFDEVKAFFGSKDDAEMKAQNVKDNKIFDALMSESGGLGDPATLQKLQKYVIANKKGMSSELKDKLEAQIERHQAIIRTRLRNP